MPAPHPAPLSWAGPLLWLAEYRCLSSDAISCRLLIQYLRGRMLRVCPPKGSCSPASLAPFASFACSRRDLGSGGSNSAARATLSRLTMLLPTILGSGPVGGGCNARPPAPPPSPSRTSPLIVPNDKFSRVQSPGINKQGTKYRAPASVPCGRCLAPISDASSSEGSVIEKRLPVVGPNRSCSPVGV